MNKYDIRAIDPEKDMSTLKQWWMARKLPIPHLFPPTGAIVSYLNQDVCAGFLFKSDANVAVIAHVVADPTINKEIRSFAIDSLITTLSLLAKEEGFSAVSFSTNLTHVMSRIERLGFTKSDEGVSVFGRVF